ncbi:MAG: hypothetical protein IT184_12525 [Acidobacteria bacterium]|nr:hypothetical protein [Acidobacteriota bacterium]
MTACSRREFGKVVLAGIPLAVTSARRLGAAGGVVFGATTSSFRDLPRVTGRDNVEDVIRALKAARVADVELGLSTIEPAPPSTAPFLGGTPAYPRRIVLSAEEIASTNAAARTALRAWRLSTPTDHFERLRATFAGAGLRIHACALAFDDSFTDEELDATLRQVKALGVRVVGSPMTFATARRVAPVAEHHGVSVAIHNDVEGSGRIDTIGLGPALALSPALTLKLDIGNVTADDGDPVAVLRAHLPRVSYVVVRDRRRHGGSSQPFGDGDTPIAAVLDTLAAAPSSPPALVDYDFPGLRPAVDEVAAAVGYLSGLRS